MALRAGDTVRERDAREYPWRFEVCKDCGRDNVAGFTVTDAIWEEVMGDTQVVLCIFCFDARATARGIEWDREPINWWPTSHVAAEKWSRARHIREMTGSQCGGS